MSDWRKHPDCVYTGIIPPEKDNTDGLRLLRMQSFWLRKLPELWQGVPRHTRQDLPVCRCLRQLFFDCFNEVNHFGLQFLKCFPVDRFIPEVLIILYL